MFMEGGWDGRTPMERRARERAASFMLADLSDGERDGSIITVRVVEQQFDVCEERRHWASWTLPHL